MPKPFVNSPALEINPAFSPDGRWIAYQSNESGRLDVYVRPYPGPGGKWQISPAGGMSPKWSRSSKEIFYFSPEHRIMVASYTASGDSFQASTPTVRSETVLPSPPGLSANYALHPDGKRFAVLRGPGSELQPQANRITFIFNFFDDLRRKAPTHK